MSVNFHRICFTVGLYLGMALVLQPDSQACGLRLSEPKSHFDGVDSLGHVNLIEKLGQLQLGKSKLPVFLIFNSGNARISPYVGASFDIPLLSSRIVAVDENTFKFFEPDGWDQTFWRDTKNPNLLNGGSGWKAEIRGDTISAWADCGGNKATFVRGRITELEVDGAKLEFSYNGDRVSEIRSNGAPVVKVLTDSKTNEVTGLSFGMGDSVSFIQDQKPKVQVIGGRNLVAAVEKTLSQVVFPDGTKRSFVFSVDEKVRPTIKLNGVREITWDPATKNVVKDGDWQYDVKPVEGNFENSLITRSKPSGGQKESWVHDGVKGEDVTRLADGSSIRANWFTSGQLYGRPRSLTKTTGDKTQTLHRWDYDENGRLVRETVNDGEQPGVIKYSYDTMGRILIRENSNGEVTYYDHKDEKRVETLCKNGSFVEMREFSGGNLAKTQFWDGSTESNQYDGANRKTTLIDSKGKVVAEKKYSNGRLLESKLESRVENYTYDGDSNRVTEVDWNDGTKFRYIYDDAGNQIAAFQNEVLLWFRHAFNVGSDTRVFYDRDGNIARAIDISTDTPLTGTAVLEKAKIFSQAEAMRLLSSTKSNNPPSNR